jgi:hypothetical protein
MIKALKKLGTGGMYLNTIKAINNKHVANILLNGEKNEPTSSNIRNKTRASTLFTHST